MGLVDKTFNLNSFQSQLNTSATSMPTFSELTTSKGLN